MTPHAVKVLSKKSIVTKGANKRFLRVESWRPEWKVISIRVPPGVYRGATPDAGVVVDTSPGALGWEWVPEVHFGGP